ncbi:MAG: hypothetical protein KBG83_07985 [Bacteroidetes bacterium]|jgi:hypothetical protein|nr:hypothetical protein [Bacteroidota bacterium]
MQLKELVKKLEQIKNKGFIQSLRKGPTGIGHLLEYEIGLNDSI